jgi:methionine-rich copper-binding protein CopC
MSPARRFAAGLAVAAVAILATAAPASAHDALIHSTPEADQRLETAPETIELVYSGDLLVLGDSADGAVVLVVDGEGHDWASGEVEVRGNTVTATLDAGMPDAGYQVRWQVVSEDGHPIAGSVPFTIGDGEPLSTQTDAEGTSGDSGDEPPAADQTITAETDGALRVLLVGGAGAAIAVVALLLYRILRRTKTASAPPAQGDDAEEL